MKPRHRVVLTHVLDILSNLVAPENEGGRMVAEEYNTDCILQDKEVWTKVLILRALHLIWSTRYKACVCMCTFLSMVFDVQVMQILIELMSNSDEQIQARTAQLMLLLVCVVERR